MRLYISHMYYFKCNRFLIKSIIIIITGSAKFMATHILTWFSNKNEQNWKFIAAAYSQITCKLNSSIIYSTWPPLFLIICFSPSWKALHEVHRTSWWIKAHSRFNLVFRFSRKSWEVRQALLSRMDHTEKSKGFRSGLLEGQSSLLMNAGMWAWIHRWVILEPCKGAESCWKVQGVHSTFSRAHGNSSLSKMSEMYRCLFNFTPEGMKTRRDLPVAVTAAQTITEVGFWRRLTLLPSTNVFLPQTRSFWWLTHYSTSNFFSSENTKLDSVPSSMRLRKGRNLSALIRSCVGVSSWSFCIL